MKSLNRSDVITALAEGFDHELALLQAGERRIVKMEFSAAPRLAHARNLGYTCLPAGGHYEVDPTTADVVYGSGNSTTFFVGRREDVLHALELEVLERGPDPDVRQEAMQALGKMLGYPSCCTEAYRLQATQDESASFARLLGCDSKVSGHFANNLFVLDHQVISHFPCSLNCSKSAAVGLKSLDLCREISPTYADALETLLRCPIRVWDRFRVQVEHPTLGTLYADNLSAEPRVRTHRRLNEFLADLPLLPENGTRVTWSD